MRALITGSKLGMKVDSLRSDPLSPGLGFCLLKLISLRTNNMQVDKIQIFDVESSMDKSSNLF